MAKVTEEQKKAYGDNYSHVDVDEAVTPKLMTDESEEGDLTLVQKHPLAPQTKVKFTTGK